MDNSRPRRSILTVFSGLGWPLILGSSASCAFYLLIHRGPLDAPSMLRYFASHPVSYCATWMFFVGLTALGLKMLDVLAQFQSLGRISLPLPAEGRGHSIDDCPEMQEMLERMPTRLRYSYLGKRLYEALAFVHRQGSAAELEEELKYLEDTDVARQQEGYSLVRIIIWATPMLGFLGTVIGITRALGDLDPQELATSIQTAMEGLLSGLYVAFDTTALALSLSILLMFVQFVVDRMETQLLAAVTSQVSEDLAGQFEQLGTSTDPHLASIQKMACSVMESTEQLVKRQAELWQGTINEAHDRWQAVTATSTEQMRTALGIAMEKALESYADRFAETERMADDRVRQRWEQWQLALSDGARTLHAQQAEMARQGETMAKVLQATGDVVKLEKSLNDNLRLLAGSKNFEDTVMSLAAAIHLLNARLGDSSNDAPKVDLSSNSSQGRAA